MSWKYKLPFVTNPQDKLVEGLAAIRGGADVVALLPYDDGTFFLKPAEFNKELIGGIGGYETEDGDKIVVDGSGEAVRSLFGVPMVLAVDPTEHAAAVDPIKALIAHKEEIGEWVRVDKKGNIVEAGSAVEAVGEVDVAADGGMVGELAQAEGVSFDAAMAKLAQMGEVTKVYDIAPPSAVEVDEDGEWHVESATHIAVDQSKAANLMPTTFDTTELNTALDKARMEEHEEGKLMKWFIYGGISFSIVTILVVGIMFVMFSIGGV